MRNTMMVLMSGMLAASLLAGCNDDSTPTSPSSGNPMSPPTSGGGTSGGTPGGTGGGTGGGTTGAAAPATAAVTVGDIFFQSALNGSRNPAVDTVAVNGTVTWTWATTENLPHSVQSTGSPSFTSSAIQTGAGQTYSFTFTAPGSYQYDCAVHGQMMTGTIVVLAATGTPSMSPATPPPAAPPPANPPSGY